MPLTLSDTQSSILTSSRSQVNYALRNRTTGAPPDTPTINAFLNWPIGDAVRQVGLGVIVASAVSDIDIGAVSDALVPRFLAIALLQTKRAIRGQLERVDMTMGTDTQKLSQLAAQLDKEIKDLLDDIVVRFGVRPAAPIVAPMTSAADPGAGGLYPQQRRPALPFGGFEFP